MPSFSLEPCSFIVFHLGESTPGLCLSMTKESFYVRVALEGTSPCGSKLTRVATGPGICIDPFKFDDAYIW